MNFWFKILLINEVLVPLLTVPAVIKTLKNPQEESDSGGKF